MLLKPKAKNILIKMATRALLVGLEEIPIAGAAVKLGRDWWKILRDAQATEAESDRIAQLEQAAACSPEDARQLAKEAIREAEREDKKNIEPERAEAVVDLIAAMPAQIRDRTQAILKHAQRLGAAAETVLPVTAQFQKADQEAFYKSLFPPRRPQFRVDDSVPNYNPQWKLKQLLGMGGFGEVWLARHEINTKLPPMAIKFCQDKESTNLLRREMENLVALYESLDDTPYIVALRDSQFANPPYWLAFEYIEGGTLENRMRLGAIDWPTAWALFEPILKGMAQVHKLKIVHRDLKPANILLVGGTQPRITDFGIGKVLAEQTAKTRRTSPDFTTVGYGTLDYMSQEQQDGESADPRDDVYTLGLLLWQMLTGTMKPLRSVDSLSKIEAPEGIKQAIYACVFISREKRPAHAGALLALMTDAEQHDNAKKEAQKGENTKAKQEAEEDNRRKREAEAKQQQLKQEQEKRREEDERRKREAAAEQQRLKQEQEKRREEDEHRKREAVAEQQRLEEQKKILEETLAPWDAVQELTEHGFHGFQEWMEDVFNAFSLIIFSLSWTIWIIVYMFVAYLVNLDMTDTAGYIFLGLCLLVLFVEFFKSGDIKPLAFLIDITSSVLSLVIATALLSFLVFTYHAPTFFHWFGFAIIVGDAILSPIHSFRTVLRNMEVSGSIF